MNSWETLFDVLALLATAFVLGAVCERLRQSAVLGYLVAGMLLGPHALGWVASQREVETLAELGVAMLLFAIGLEFSWQRLTSLGGTVLLAGLLQVVVTLGVTAGAALSLGFGGATSMALGAVIALSSTACVLRLLAARGELESQHGRNALAILLVQDLAVVPLVILVTVLGGGGSFGDMALEVGRTLGMAFLLALILVLVCNKLIPVALGAAPMQRNRELPVLLAVVAGLGSTWGAHEIGLSPALGAFLAGMFLGGSTFATQIRADVGVLRTLLLTLFFGSIGMLGDLAWSLANWAAVLGVVGAIVVGKGVIAWAVLWVLGVRSRHALAAGICLSQVGEFSFVLATAARGTLLDDEHFRLLVSATLVTLLLTPGLVAGAPAIVFRLAALARRSAENTGDSAETETAAQGHVVVIGFGPAGEAAAAALQVDGVPTSVVDLNPRSVERARRLGLTAVVGDATHNDVLEHVRVSSAAAVVVTVPDPATTQALVVLTRAMAPHATVLARCRYHRWSEAIDLAGAHVILDEEQEIGARLAEELERLLASQVPGSKSQK